MEEFAIAISNLAAKAPPPKPSRGSLSTRKRRTKPPKIVCAGQATLDFINFVPEYPRENSENRVLHSVETIGGPVGRGAIAASRLGADVHLLATVGTGVYANALQDLFKLEDIHTNWFVDPEVKSQRSAIIVSGEQGHRTVFWTPQPRADQEMLKGVPKAFQSADCAFIDCTDEALAFTVAEFCNERDIPIVLDTGSYKPWCEPLLPLCDFVISPEKFFRVRSPDASSLSKGIRALSEQIDVSLVCATLGERGGRYKLQNSDTIHKYDAFSVDPVDTCGAGDTFHGAFAFAVGSGLSAADGLDLSAWAAAKKCERHGNDGIPYQFELQRELGAKLPL
ncbi:MAG: PfkB family carbohydrate kinase [Henriciella sp.]|uniref:carbohydrate kinase family protein n=1 Tax=Henriciella sp. TaxID=1968823 RepID=UPI003C7423C6